MFASGFVVDGRLAIDDKSARNQGRNPTTGWQDADSHGKAPSHTQTSSNVSQTHYCVRICSQNANRQRLDQFADAKRLDAGWRSRLSGSVRAGLSKDTPADLCLQGLVGRLCSPVHWAAHASAMRGSQRMGEHRLDYGRTGRCSAPLGLRVFWLGFPRGIWRVASDHRPNPGALLRV